MLPAPLFANEINVVITLIVLAVSAIGWVFNQLSGKNQPPPVPRPKRQRPEPEEVNVFLEEPRERAAPPKPKKRPPAPPPARTAPARTVPEKASPLAKKPGTDLASRHLQTSDLGSGVRAHASEAVGHRVEQAVQDHMQRRVDKSVNEHLGQFSAAAQLSAPASSQPQGIDAAVLVQMLRNPASVRQAIIISTVLSPAPGLRRKSKSP